MSAIFLAHAGHTHPERIEAVWSGEITTIAGVFLTVAIIVAAVIVFDLTRSSKEG